MNLKLMMLLGLSCASSNVFSMATDADSKSESARGVNKPQTFNFNVGTNEVLVAEAVKLQYGERLNQKLDGESLMCRALERESLKDAAFLLLAGARVGRPELIKARKLHKAGRIDREALRILESRASGWARFTSKLSK